MNPLQQQIKQLLHEQLNSDEKMASKIHLFPTISLRGIMEYLSVSPGKANELLKAFILRIEQGHVTHIRGELDLYGTKITSLGNLKTVGGRLCLMGTKITSLGNLKSVGGNLNLMGVKITSLDNLQSVGGSLNLHSTSIKSLGNLQTVGGSLYLPKDETLRTELDKVQVGGEIYYDS